MISVPLIIASMSSVMSHHRTLEAITAVNKAMPINGILSEGHTCKVLQEVLNGRKIRIKGKEYALPHNRFTRLIERVIHRLKLFSPNYRREFGKATRHIYYSLLRHSKEAQLNPLLGPIKCSNITAIEVLFSKAIYLHAKDMYKDKFLKDRCIRLEQERDDQKAAQIAIKTNLGIPYPWTGIKSVHHKLPKEISIEILSLARTHLAECALVSKEWRQMVYDETLYRKIVPSERFGTEAWRRYIGDPGEEPLLPLCIFKDIEKGPGLLTLVPEKVNIISEKGTSISVPMNLINIGKLVQNPKEGFKTGYHSDVSSGNTQEIIGKRYFKDASLEDIQKEAIQDQISKEPEKTHWVWINKKAIGKGAWCCPLQRHLAQDESLEIGSTNGSHASKVLDTVVTLFMEKLRTGKSSFNIDENHDFWICVDERYLLTIYRVVSFSNLGLQIRSASPRDPVIGGRDKMAVLAARRSFGRDNTM
jgi:hypothetical protein